MRDLNKAVFFETVSGSLFDGRPDAKQADGLTTLLDHWREHHADCDSRWLAYILATVHHEVDRTMRPIREYGDDPYFLRMYDIEGDRPDVARKLGNFFAGDGIRFHGRGFVQLTGRANYADWEVRLGTDLTSSRTRADEVLDPALASRILFEGMIEGTFTGKKLSDFFRGVREDWVQARQIVNGLDRADLIAAHARTYHTAILRAVGRS